MKNTKEILKGINERFLKENAEKIINDDIIKVTEKADEITKKFIKGGPLERFIGDVKLLISLVKDYWTGNYKKIPYWVIGAIVFTLLYVLNPLDLIPDVIPGIGQIDDAAVVGICLYLIEKELQEYKQWKINDQ